MRKIFAFLLAVMLIASMGVPAYAVTPRLGVPNVPQISNIKFKVELKLPDNFWNNFKFNFCG